MPEARLKVIPVRMNSNALTIVDDIATKEGRSRSDVIRRLLAEAITARRDVKAATPPRVSRRA